MRMRKNKVALYLFNAAALAGFVCLLVYSLINRKNVKDLFYWTSYYFIFLLMIVWAVQTVLFLKGVQFSLKLLLKKYWPGILLALVLTVMVFASVHVRFKTLSDETNLLAISRAMTNDKACFNATMGKYYYGNLNDINYEVPKRPLVFPFMVSLLHTVSGFRYQNAFAFNFIVMLLLLAGVYIGTRKLIDAPSAVAAMFFVLSYPVFTIFGTSGGFDLFNAAVFLMILAATCHFIKEPSAEAFSFIFASLLVFANIRYESIAFLVILPVLVFKKIRWQELKDYSYVFFIAPLVCLPYIWQRMLKGADIEKPADVSAFSIGALFENATKFLVSMADLKYFLPYAGLLSAVSILIFIYLIVEVARGRIWLERQRRYSAVVVTLLVLSSTLIYFSYFFGDCTHPSTARFFIILSIVLALGPVVLKALKPNCISGTGLLLISIACFLFYHPIAVEGRFINTLRGNRITEQSIAFVSGINDKNILTISERPGQFTALGYGAINFSHANQNKDKILREISRHLFSRVFVFQEIAYDSRQPTKDTALAAEYKLTNLYEIQISATEFFRISEVKLTGPSD
jgi:hypothetical protein